MQKRIAFTLSAVAFVGIVARAPVAVAGWPADGARTIHGLSCTPFVSGADNYLSYCPFISDFIDGSDAYFAHDNATTYIEYHVQSTSSGASTSVQSCRQRWTGASLVCTTPTSTFGTGYQDLGVYSFGTLGGDSDQYDFYYLAIATTESVDVIYGAVYF